MGVLPSGGVILGGMKATTVVLWILWALLFLAWPADMLVALMRDPIESSEVDTHFASILGYVGFISLALTFFIKWLLLRFVVSPKRASYSSPWAIVIYIIGSLMI